MTRNIPVFLASDNNYAPMTATTILSILAHTKAHIDFYILASDISERSKNDIMHSIDKYKNYSIEFIDIKQSTFDILPESEEYVSKATYNRLLIPQIKPELKKVIYSDVDVIFTDDIEILYNENLEGKIIGVVQDAIYRLHPNFNNYIERLKVSSMHQYFYAGLLLIDAQKWREQDITSKILKLGQDNFDILKQGDQDLLNMFFDNNYKELSPKYEATNGYLLNMKKFDKSIRNELKKIVIRHYESAEKPWNSDTFQNKKMPLQDEFWKYAKKTVFYKKLYNSYLSNLLQNTSFKYFYLFNFIPLIKIQKDKNIYTILIFSIPFIKIITKETR